MQHLPSPAKEPSEESVWPFHRGIDVRGEEETGFRPQLAGRQPAAWNSTPE